MKKKIWAIPMVLVAALCTVLLSACGGPSVEELIRQDLESAFGEISADDEELVEAMSESSGDSFEMLGIDTQDFAESYLDGFEYKIDEVTVDEENGVATAVVKVKMKSVTDIMTEFSSQFETWIMGLDQSALPTEEELYAKGGEILMDVTKATEPHESDVVIDYAKDDEGTWEAAEDAEMAIMDAML